MERSVQKDDRVRVFHQLDRDGDSVICRVTRVLAHPGFIEAEIEDSTHDLATHQRGDEVKKRILTVSPDLYEVIA